MFSNAGITKLNDSLTYVWKIFYLNLLWLGCTLAGLGIFGIGPATYAYARYLDRWFRYREEPPATVTFFQYAWHRPVRSIAISWIYGAILAVIITNLLTSTNTGIRVANLILGLVVTMSALYIYPVMAATSMTKILELIPASVLVALGSLHLTAATMAITGAVWFATYRYAFPLFLLIGVGVPITLTALATRKIFNDLIVPEDAELDPSTSSNSVDLLEKG